MHERYRPIAWVLGSLISSSSVLTNLYRNASFKGKLLISEYVRLPPENGEYVCKGIKFDIDFSDGIQRAIYFNTYERREIEFLEGYVRQGWKCVDLGANVGFYTLNLAKLVGPRGYVLAVEAAPKNFERLLRNVELNAFQNCKTIHCAVTKESGPVRFYTSPTANSGWGRIGAFDGASGEIEVAGFSFDSLLEKSGISSIDFLKIDIEGHELQFLEGAVEALTCGKVKRMLVEYCGYALERQGISLADYVQAFEEYGFRPVHFALSEISAAKRGEYRPANEILNLLFEHNSVES